MLKTVKEVQSVDVVLAKGLVVRFESDDGEQCVFQVATEEARALADMLVIALAQPQASGGRSDA